MRVMIPLLFLMLVLRAESAQPYRLWRLRSGMTYDAALVEDDGTAVTLKKRTGPTAVVKRKDLSKQDLDFLDNIGKAKANDKAGITSVGFKMIDIGMAKDAVLKLGNEGMILEFVDGMPPPAGSNKISLRPGPTADSKYKNLGSAGDKIFPWVRVEVTVANDKVRDITVWGPAYPDTDIGTDLQPWLDAAVNAVKKDCGKPTSEGKGTEKESGLARIIGSLRRLSYYEHANWQIGELYEVSVCANFEKVEGKYQGMIKFIDAKLLKEERESRVKKLAPR